MYIYHANAREKHDRGNPMIMRNKFSAVETMVT